MTSLIKYYNDLTKILVSLINKSAGNNVILKYKKTYEQDNHRHPYTSKLLVINMQE